MSEIIGKPVEAIVERMPEGAIDKQTPDMIYQDGEGRQCEIILNPKKPGCLAQNARYFANTENREICYPDGREVIVHVGFVKRGMERAEVMLDAHGNPCSPVFDQIRGDSAIHGVLVTKYYENLYELNPDGSVAGLLYSHKHDEPLKGGNWPEELPGVSLTPGALDWEMDEAILENGKRFPMDDFFEFKRRGENVERSE